MNRHPERQAKDLPLCVGGERSGFVDGVMEYWSIRVSGNNIH
jgi:hypothetical protein